MNKEILLESILKNSLSEKSKFNINESLSVSLTDSLKESNVDTDSNVDIDTYELFVKEVISDNIRTMLAYDICDVTPISSPKTIVLARESNKDKFKIISKSVEVQNTKCSFEITHEAIEDLKAISGNTTLFTNYMAAFTKNKQNAEFMKYIKDNAVKVDDFTLPKEAKENNEINLFYINKKVNDLISDMNKENFKTYDAFCILPSSQSGGILGLGSTYSKSVGILDDNSRSTLFYLGEINNVEYYINPDPKETDTIIGLHSKKEKGVSSLLFFPYNYIVNVADRVTDDHIIYNVWCRNLWTLNPMHTPDKPMLVKLKFL